MKYGVQAAAFSDAIHIGRINQAGTQFTDKEDHTAEILHAVAQWVEKNHGGDAWVTVGDKRLDITVTAIAPAVQSSPASGRS